MNTIYSLIHEAFDTIISLKDPLLQNDDMQVDSKSRKNMNFIDNLENNVQKELEICKMKIKDKSTCEVENKKINELKDQIKNTKCNAKFSFFPLLLG